MSRRVLLLVIVVVVAACSADAEPTTTTTSAVSPEPDTNSTTVVATTQPVVTVDATFAIDRIVFGEEGWIELVNTGPQAGNVHGYWIAVHPFYLELPSSIVEVGQTITVALGPEPDPGALVEAGGLLPALEASGGEVGLYTNGSFGDPDSIVDYIEWGSGGHFRSTVAEAAGLWDESLIVPMSGDEAGIQVLDGPLVLNADLSVRSAEG